MGIPFECDLCHFRNCNYRDPDLESSKDRFTLLCIRRATLDACWSRESSTVSSNLNRLRLDYWDSVASISMRNPLPVLGRNDIGDKVGMKPAMMTLNASLREGRYTSNLQYDSMRRTQTWFGNAHEAGESAGTESIFASDMKKLHVTEVPTASRWFPRFMLGAKRRMGVIRRQNEALTVHQILAMLEITEQDWHRSACEKERKEIEEVACFAVIAFALSLRGEETPMVSIDGLVEYWEETKRYQPPFIMVALRGRFKGEQNLRWHLLPMADMGKSKIPTRRWVSRLLHRRVTIEGSKHGYLFARERGQKGSIGDYDPLFRAYIERTMKARPGLFPKGVDVEDFSLRRSPRRGSTTSATNNKVHPLAIELMNRWRMREKARGAEPGLSMRQVYTQVRDTIDAALEYSLSH